MIEVFWNCKLSQLSSWEASKITRCCFKCNIIIIFIVTLGGSHNTIFCGETKFSLFALLGILSTIGTTELVFLKESERILFAECDTQTSSSLPWGK